MRALLIALTLLAPLQRGAAQALDPSDPDLNKAVQQLTHDLKHGKFPTVNFLFDSDHLSEGYYPMLDAVAEFLIENDNIKLVLLGHTCVIGTEQYNYDLGKRRATSIREYLVKQGVAPPTITYRSFGYSIPKKDNSNEEGREENRRVELRFTRRNWNSVF